VEAFRTVEWVANHDEAHGQMLVRGASLGGMIDCACAAVAEQYPYERSCAHLRVIRVGWWVAAPCNCSRTMAVSNHPSWHYRPARRNDDEVWYGAEMRVELRHGG